MSDDPDFLIIDDPPVAWSPELREAAHHWYLEALKRLEEGKQ